MIAHNGQGSKRGLCSHPADRQDIGRESSLAMTKQGFDGAKGLMLTSDGPRIEVYFHRTDGRWKISRFILQSQSP